MRIVREGWTFILGCLVAANFFLLVGSYLKSFLGITLGIFFFLATAFCVYFFRDPARVIPEGENLILSPADGKILEIIQGKDPIGVESVWILRIFLSVFEPHLQRSPWIRFNVTTCDDARVHRWLEQVAQRPKDEWTRQAAE